MKKGLEKNTQKYSIVEYSIKIYPSFERCNGTHPLIFTILVNPHIGPVIGCSKYKINPARLEKEFKKHVKKCCKKQLLEPNWGGVKANFYSWWEPKGKMSSIFSRPSQARPSKIKNETSPSLEFFYQRVKLNLLYKALIRKSSINISTFYPSLSFKFQTKLADWTCNWFFHILRASIKWKGPISGSGA